jgi:hypothetical protein
MSVSTNRIPFMIYLRIPASPADGSAKSAGNILPPAFAEAATVLRHSGFATAQHAGMQITQNNAESFLRDPRMIIKSLCYEN